MSPQCLHFLLLHHPPLLDPYLLGQTGSCSTHKVTFTQLLLCVPYCTGFSPTEQPWEGKTVITLQHREMRNLPERPGRLSDGTGLQAGSCPRAFAPAILSLQAPPPDAGIAHSHHSSLYEELPLQRDCLSTPPKTHPSCMLLSVSWARMSAQQDLEQPGICSTHGDWGYLWPVFLQSRGWVAPIVDSLCFVGQTVSVTTPQRCCFSTEVAQIPANKWEWPCAPKPHFQRVTLT